MRNMIKTVIVAAAVVLGLARARRGQAARRRVDRDARRSQPPGGRRPGRRHVAVARVPGPALRRGEAVAGARAQPRRRAGLRRAGSGGGVAAAAGAAVAQREDPARTTGEHRRVVGDPPRGRPERAVGSAARARATSTRSAIPTTGFRPRTRAPSRGCWPSASPRSTQAGRPRTRPSSRASRRGWRRRRRNGKPPRRRCKGTRIVTFHKSWSYVARWLGLEEVGYIEPKPGIPPTANHTAQLVELMKKTGVRLVVVESFYPSTMAKFVADNGKARLVARPRTSARRPRSRPTSIWSTR